MDISPKAQMARCLCYDDPELPLRLNLYGHPKAGLHWEQHCSKHILACGFEKVKGHESLFVHKEKCLFLSVYVDDFKMVGITENLAPMWEKLRTVKVGSSTGLDLEPPVPVQANVYLGCKQENEEPDRAMVAQKADIFDGFFLNKRMQDEADAQRSAQSPVKEASRKRKAKKAKHQQVSKLDDLDEDAASEEPKHHLQAEKVLERGVDQNPKHNFTSVNAYHYAMCGHVQQCVGK